MRLWYVKKNFSSELRLIFVVLRKMFMFDGQTKQIQIIFVSSLMAILERDILFPLRDVFLIGIVIKVNC